MNVKIFVYSIALLIVICISSWYALESARKSLEQQPQSNPSNPDFYMKNVTYLQFDSNGVLQNETYTPSLTHYAADDSYLFVKPQMKMLDKSRQVWSISANSGKSTRGSDTVFLWDNVNINQFDPINKLQKLTINTSEATIYPQKKFAKTDKPVVINQIDSIIHATGATVDFKASEVKLLSKVQGQYEAGSKNK